MAVDVAEVKRQSVQVLRDASQGDSLAVVEWSRAYHLPRWGTRRREKELRVWLRNEYFWLAQSAFAGMVNKWASAPWEIKGPKRGPNVASRFQGIFRQSSFGQGWTRMMKMVGLDYLRQDGGAYIEVIAPGRADKAPTGPVAGLAYLDSLRCFPTGDPEYPVIYYDLHGGRHILHRTRVLHLVDQPDGDEGNPGYGLCALSRGIAILTQQMYMLQYTEGKLDDKPSPGFMVLKGLTDASWQAAVDKYDREQSTDNRPVWGKLIRLLALDPAVDVELNLQTFSQAPESWSYKEYMELHVNAFALALGTDVQELWQLTGGNIGSGQQSQVLHQKSRGNTFGTFLTECERVFNDVLPESCEFQWKQRDAAEDQEQAQSANTWSIAVAANVNAGLLTADEGRQVLANKVEAIQDAVTDADGELVRLPDADPKDPEQAVDDTGPAPDVTPQEQQTADSQKDFADTRASFISSFTDLVTSGLSGDTNRRRAGIVLRAQLNRLGRQAYADGLKAGGIEDALDAEDQAAVAAWLVEQSGYVTTFLNSLYKSGLSAAQVEQRAEMWANKSLESAYNLGLASADKNGLYEWRLGKTEEHCATCAALNGQAHRLKKYVRRGLMPKSSKLACKGFLCDCSLVRVTGRAHGRWPVAIKEHVHALSD